MQHAQKRILLQRYVHYVYFHLAPEISSFIDHTKAIELKPTREELMQISSIGQYPGATTSPRFCCLLNRKAMTGPEVELCRRLIGTVVSSETSCF